MPTRTLVSLLLVAALAIGFVSASQSASQKAGRHADRCRQLTAVKPGPGGVAPKWQPPHGHPREQYQ